jgi:hypothetical protein
MDDEAAVRMAERVIRQGDSRVDISLRGHLAELLDRIADHVESMYPCCDNGTRQCWEIGAPAMSLVDAINREGRK